MKLTPKPAVVRRGRGRGRGAGAGAVVPYARATPQTNGAGDFQRPAQKGSHVQAVLHEYPLTPTPLTVRAQRQHRRSEAGFRPRIVELDPDTDRTLQRTPAPSTVGRRSSVQSRLSSVTSFSRGDVITSTRLESPAQAPRRSAAASVASGTPTPFAKPRTPAQRRRSGQRASEVQQPPPPPPPPVQETSAAAPQTSADNWQTPISRRSAADSASRSASSAAASSANHSKASAKQNSTASAKRNTTVSSKRNSTVSPKQKSTQSGPPSGGSAQRGSGGRGRGRPRKNPSPQSGGSGQLGSAQRGSGGRGRGSGSGGRGRGRPRKQPSPQPSPEPSDHEEMEASEEEQEEENVTLDNSDDRTFRPSPGERRRLAAAEAAAARRRTGDRTATGGRGRTGRTGRDTSELGRTTSSAAATGRGDQRKSSGGSPRKSAGQSRMSTNMTARSRRSSNHPALTEEPARRSSAASRGGKRSSTAALRCPLTVQVAGRSRVIAANSTEDVLESVEDLITAARTRPLQCYPDIGKFQWDLDQCVIDLLALKKAKRQGAVKMLTAVRKVRTAAEDVLQPVKVELVELYNAAFKADKERRRDEEVRAFLFDDDEAER